MSTLVVTAAFPDGGLTVARRTTDDTYAIRADTPLGSLYFRLTRDEAAQLRDDLTTTLDQQETT